MLYRNTVATLIDRGPTEYMLHEIWWKCWNITWGRARLSKDPKTCTSQVENLMNICCVLLFLYHEYCPISEDSLIRKVSYNFLMRRFRELFQFTTSSKWFILNICFLFCSIEIFLPECSSTDVALYTHFKAHQYFDWCILYIEQT